MNLREIKPDKLLSSYVRCYRIIDFEFKEQTYIPPKIYTPRPEQCLQFFPYSTKIDYDKNSIVPKNALLFGQHSITNLRTVYSKFLSFQIVFQTGALFRLIGLPATSIANTAVEASEIFGKEIDEINDKLYYTENHNDMTRIVESFLLKKALTAKKSVTPIDYASILMTENEANYTLDDYVSRSFLCHRQFNRNFLERTGISPKAYLRLVRFDKAYRMKNIAPQLSWFKIAINCGYEDYQHLSKDFMDFTHYTPNAFFKMESPERLLGSEETY